jgi:hypothetical protein
VFPFGRSETVVPVLGVMRYRRTETGGLIEINPTRCPLRCHTIGAGQLALGWNNALRMREYICWSCHAKDPAMSTWCVSEPIARRMTAAPDVSGSPNWR